ncbi:AAA family ATPase [Bradyrhizobium sp. NDS-1]|uniref:AAA family ATPase n=1 Tax=Bradyrhizobium sp. NDS-1 TaxID=3080014 RepID=UPI00293E111C|nr:AAA family ATPase [Bradyrhizobium sp. NDS-1]WOH75550.1 AAA family ATPase [Bradyrhizobium sp. NDS-1]
MKIRQIDLYNFRQFYGTTKLALACEDDRNVTLIHGENGVGKTTILNAVYWAMFDDVTPRFEQKNRIVNFEAEKEGIREAKVEVEFEFNGEIYRASRTFSIGSAKTSFLLYRIDRGSHVPIRAPETFVNSVIPKAMARYFFFDGEHAETFAAEKNQTAGAAVRSMLGCDLAEEGMKDLKAVAGQYTKQTGDGGGDDELKSLRDKLTELEDQVARDEADLADQKKSVEQLSEQKSLIDEALRLTAGASEVQELRDGLKTREEQIERDVRERQAELVRWIGEKSITVLSKKALLETASFVDSEAVEGRLPSPYREDFIQSLLHRENCICCRDLKPTTSEWNAVATLLKTAGNTEAESRLARVRIRLHTFQDLARNAPNQLSSTQERLGQLLEERRGVAAELGEVSKKLEGLDLHGVRERERARGEIEKNLGQRHQRIGDLEATIRNAASRIDSLAQEIKVKGAKNERTRTIMRKRQLALDAAILLKSRLERYESRARSAIEGEINEILERTARRDYQFKFDDDFSMALTHSDIDGPVPKSGGENQLMSLAFTAALVRFSKERVGNTDELLSPGTVAPLVLDAPIGHLDQSYREATAEFIPEMAGQVILLLSSAHMSAGVYDALKARVGKEYVLISENRRAREGKSNDPIALNGRNYNQSLFNQERNLTRVEEVA